MKEPEWERVKAIFDEAAERPQPERERYLAAACGADAGLRAEVERLLTEHDSAGSFLEKRAGWGLLDNPEGSIPGPMSAWLHRPVLKAGELVAERFEIIRLIGRGGMGEVYEAEDRELGGRIALKTLRAPLTDQPEGLRRFKREIQLARKVSHRNVCRVFDVARHSTGDSRVDFLSMELLNGETLSSYLKSKGKLSPREALPLARQMAAGLDALHEAGVIHRDFKPGNVMLVAGGEELRAVVCDFGLARSFASPASDVTQVTQPSQLLGTPDYMAPEQLAGETVGPASDVYAFGLVLYEMVTGHKPYPASVALKAAVLKATKPPESPRTHTPDLDENWVQALETCLRREPAERPGLRAALAALELGPGTSQGSMLGRYPLNFGRLNDQLGRRAVIGMGVGLTAALGWWIWKDKAGTVSLADLGQQALDQARLVTSSVFLGAASEEDALDATAKIDLALSLSVQGQFDRAHRIGLEAYRLVERSPLDFELWERLWVRGRFAQLRYDHVRAHRHFMGLAVLGAETEDPELRAWAARAHERLAIIYSFLGSTSFLSSTSSTLRKTTSALVEIDRSLELRSNSVGAKVMKSQFLVEDERPAEALSVSQRAKREHPKDALPHFGVALAHLAAGHTGKARVALNEFGNSDGDNLYGSWARLHVVQADVLDGQWEVALQRLKKDLSMSVWHKDYERELTRRLWIARLSVALGDAAEAERQLGRVLEVHAVPETAVAVRSAAAIALELGARELVIRCRGMLGRLIESYPGLDGRENPYMSCQLLHVEALDYLAQGRLSEARVNLEDVEELISDPGSRRSLGRLLEAEQRYEEAGGVYEGLLGMKGRILAKEFALTWIQAHLHVAQCARLSGANRKARRYYDEFLGLTAAVEGSPLVNRAREEKRLLALSSYGPRFHHQEV